MEILLLKLIITPLIIGGASLVARRWGSAVAGCLAGLPITSGPISVFLALEQGAPFAASAAHGSLLGISGSIIFCLVYALGAERLRWPASFSLALAAYALLLLLLSALDFSLAASSLLALLLLLAGLFLVRARPVKAIQSPPPWWDLPLRMVTGTLLLLAITAAAHLMGPQASGILAPFPIFACVMATFIHARYGQGEVQLFIRGLLTGIFSLIAFYLTVSLSIERHGVAASYLLASLVAVVINLSSYRILTLFRRPDQKSA